jgi:hypothetical protein
MRQGSFPWDYVRMGAEVKISALSIGLTPARWGELERLPRPQKNEAQIQGESLAATA